MFIYYLALCFSNLLYLGLHASGYSFPRPLNEKEEAKYLDLMKNGDENARNILIEHNLRLVAHIIKKYHFTNAEQDDLISIGTIGLIKGINSFDNEKNIRLATYASRCIENEILMSFRAAKKSSQDVYISDPIDTDKEGNALTLLDIISCEDNIVDNLDLKIKSKLLGEYFEKTLNKREKLIIEHRYGLYGKNEMTQNELGEMLNISRSYVSRIEKKALEKLKKRFDD